jgi:hypothetical protein
MPDDNNVVTLASSTEADQQCLEAALQDDEQAARVDVSRHGSLTGFTHSESEDGQVQSLTYENPKSSRIRAEQALMKAERQLAALAFEEPSPKDLADADKTLQDFVRERQQPRTEQVEPRQSPDMVPASRVDELAEVKTVVNEHNQRLAQALQDPSFREAMAQIDPNNVNVEWSPQVGMAVAAQNNSPALVWFLGSRPDVAREIAAMPVHRGVAEVARLSAWLQGEMRPNAASAQHSSPPLPAPIKPVGGSSTKVSAVPQGEETYQDYKLRREREIRARSGRY